MAEILYESYCGIEDLGCLTLTHHGIKGQKWGIRRFQNPDGTLIHPKGRRKAKTENSKSKKKRGLSDRQKKALKIGAGVAVGAAAGYAAYKLGSGDAKRAVSSLKNLKGMSDEDLFEVVGRLEKEKKYIELEAAINNYGRSKASQVLSKAGGAAAASLATAGAIYGGKQAVKYVANYLGKDGDKLIRDMYPKKK